MNVWLITWEGTGNKVANSNKIAGVLSSRYSDSYIERLVDFLYHRTIYDVHDMAYYAHKKQARVRQSKKLWSSFGRISYGGDPWLFARQVKDFDVQYDEKKNIEIITRVEQAVYGNDIKNGYKIKQIEPEKKKRLVRPKYQPIAKEPINA